MQLDSQFKPFSRHVTATVHYVAERVQVSYLLCPASLHAEEALVQLYTCDHPTDATQKRLPNPEARWSRPVAGGYFGQFPPDGMCQAHADRPLGADRFAIPVHPSSGPVQNLGWGDQ